jgi:hypothetical protein
MRPSWTSDRFAMPPLSITSHVSLVALVRLYNDVETILQPLEPGGNGATRVRLDRRAFLSAIGATALLPRSALGQSPMHIVLLGDSIFDNAAYVAGGPDVVRQVRDILPAGSTATLIAKDGAVMADLPGQLGALPTGATHLAVSIGGNDALGEAKLLDAKVRSMSDALELMSKVRDRFRPAYARALDQVLARQLPMAVCTIYEARFPERQLRRHAATALAILNDIITREAFARGVDCIDLRVICNEDRDFANPIEPSTHGGAKIARGVLNFAAGETKGRSGVIAR